MASARFRWKPRSSINKRNDHNHKNSSWTSFHQLCVTLSSHAACLQDKSLHYVPSLHINRQACTGASAGAPVSLVTMQQQSIVLWQSHFQGHIITVLDTTRAILVCTEQTGIGCAAVNLYGKKETERERGRNVLLCHHASRQVTLNLSFISVILGCGNFNLAPSKVPEGTSRSKCQKNSV